MRERRRKAYYIGASKDLYLKVAYFCFWASDQQASARAFEVPSKKVQCCLSGGTSRSLVVAI